MKTILLTGATGFIGNHLLKAIENHPTYGTYNIVLLSSVEIKGYKSVLHKNYSFTENDFYEANVGKVDIVIHCGAYIPKGAIDSNDLNRSTSNITSTLHLINHLPNKPEKFIFFSTVDIYNHTKTEIITENTSTEPVSIYGWSKLYCEKLIEEWARNDDIIIQVLRIGHIYGSGEEQYQKIIPLTIRNVLQGKKPVIFSKGDELRSFLHISDCVKSILASLELNEYKGPINIVSGRALPIKQIVNVIVNEIDPAVSIEIQGNDLPVRNLVFDNSKMNQYLGKELISFEEGIKEEIRNFRL